MSRTSTYPATLVGVICVLFIIYSFLFSHQRTVRNDVVQGVLRTAAKVESLCSERSVRHASSVCVRAIASTFSRRG
jgi:hypothetical protein